MLSPPVASAMRPSRNGVTAAPTMPSWSASRRAWSSAASSFVGVELVAGRDRRRDKDAGARAGAADEDPCHLVGIVDPMRDREPGRSGVERRKLGVVPTEHRHAARLEVLQCAAEIEEGLRPRADRDDRPRRERVEIGRDVPGGVGTAVDAPDSARREHRDPGAGRDRQRRAHGRRPERPALRHGDGKIALGHLAGGAEDPLVLRRVDPGAGHPVEDGGDGSDRTAALDRRDASVQRLPVRRRGQPEVGEDRRFQRDHGTAAGDRVSDLR